MASQIFGVGEKDVTDKQRDGLGKLTNLSRLYGTGLDGFVQRGRLAGVTLPYGELEAAYYAFDDLWVNLADYRERVARTTATRQHKREIRSMYGRRILLDEALSLRELRGAFLNYPIQTTASDLLKMTMRNLLQGGATILASVHDEILVVASFSKLKAMEGLFREAVAQAARAVLVQRFPSESK